MIFMIKTLRRKDNIIEHNIVGTNIWSKLDKDDLDIHRALENQDFALFKNSYGWIKIPSHDYEYCRVNLRE